MGSILQIISFITSLPKLFEFFKEIKKQIEDYNKRQKEQELVNGFQDVKNSVSDEDRKKSLKDLVGKI